MHFRPASQTPGESEPIWKVHLLWIPLFLLRCIIRDSIKAHQARRQHGRASNARASRVCCSLPAAAGAAPQKSKAGPGLNHPVPCVLHRSIIFLWTLIFADSGIQAAAACNRVPLQVVCARAPPPRARLPVGHHPTALSAHLRHPLASRLDDRLWQPYERPRGEPSTWLLRPRAAR